jgi:hypothetical protein
MSAQQILTAKYGPPDHAHIVANCTTWYVKSQFPWFPVESFLINKDFKNMLYGAFLSLQAKGLHTEITSYDGCYNDRPVRGSDVASVHSWAAAIDLDAATNGMVVNPTPEQRKGKWSDEFIATMKAAGVFFGGDFIHRADPMHWALVDG